MKLPRSELSLACGPSGHVRLETLSSPLRAFRAFLAAACSTVEVVVRVVVMVAENLYRARQGVWPQWVCHCVSPRLNHKAAAVGILEILASGIKGGNRYNFIETSELGA